LVILTPEVISGIIRAISLRVCMETSPVTLILNTCCCLSLLLFSCIVLKAELLAGHTSPPLAKAGSLPSLLFKTSRKGRQRLVVAALITYSPLESIAIIESEVGPPGPET